MRAPAWLLCGFSVVVATFACGRTQVLRYLEPPFDAGVPDAGRDAGLDAGFDAGPPDAACEPRPVAFAAAVPNVMFVIDRSGSMQWDLSGNEYDGGRPSRWQVESQSLAQVLPPHDNRIAMGALMFPSVASQACDLPTTVDLSPALNNSASLLRLFLVNPLGGTPTAGALQLAANHLKGLHTASSARALVLTTDGAPNCNLNLNPNTCVCTVTLDPITGVCGIVGNCLDDTNTVATVRSLYQQEHIPTYVIGLASAQNPFNGVLDQMALAGGVPRTGTGYRFYAVDQPADLTAALDRVTAQLTLCTYLSNTLPGVNEKFVVRVGGTPVDAGATGWEWADYANGELVLHGAACDSAAQGAAVTALIECP